jgi:putative spermidine/putrescine transport system ATP-binding protein
MTTLSSSPDVQASAPSSAGTAVEFVGVSRVFGTTRALDRLDLRIEPGEFLALLGPSGCGKTTALRLLAGFDQPTTGQVLVNGRDVSRAPANKRDMGMVFQSYSLFPTMTSLENVGFGLRARGQARDVRNRRATELLDLVGLAEHRSKYPHQLSGGQQQRVALARALAIEPRVLLLDEPLSALDAKVREQLRDEIRRIQLELGVTTVFVTHDQEEALSVADRVGVMRGGRLEQLGAPAEIYLRPATPFVANFVGLSNQLPARVTGGMAEVYGTHLPLVDASAAGEGSATALVRPESIDIVADPDGPARVLATSFLGATSRVTVAMPDDKLVTAQIASSRLSELIPGTAVRVELRPVPVALGES